MQVVWLEDGQLSLRGVDPPEPAEGEARIRVLMAGICNTDLELVAGYYPYRGILGHEFVGVVEIGPDAWAGQRVVGEINVCPSCGPDERNHCDERTVLGIVDRALVRDPAHRYDSALALARALELFLQSRPETTDAAARAHQIDQVLPRRSRPQPRGLFSAETDQLDLAELQRLSIPDE